MTTTIIGTFKEFSAADATVKALYNKGFAERDISVLMTDDSKGKQFQLEKRDKTSKGIASGTVAGGTLGAIVAGATTVGAIGTGGSILAAGPIVTALSGAGAGGATGGLIGGLIGMGQDEHQAKMSKNDIEGGNVLIGVEVPDDRVSTTKNVLESHGARSVCTH